MLNPYWDAVKDRAKPGERRWVGALRQPGYRPGLDRDSDGIACES
jgi:hypothetical protein